MNRITLLLVEDNPADVKLMRLWFKQSDAIGAVDSVRLGAEALRLVCGEGEFVGRTRPDLVLVDSNLPDMLGLDVLSEIRGDSALGHVAVMMISGTFDAADAQRSRELGALDYRAKPADLDEFSALIQYIEDWASKREST